MSNTSTERKARATKHEAALKAMDDLARRVAIYAGPEAEALLAAIEKCSTLWATTAPRRKPGMKPAQTRDLVKDAEVHIVPNSDFRHLQNPLTVLEDAKTGRPTRALVKDANGVKAPVEASLLLVPVMTEKEAAEETIFATADVPATEG